MSCSAAADERIVNNGGRNGHAENHQKQLVPSLNLAEDVFAKYDSPEESRAVRRMTSDEQGALLRTLSY